MSGQASLSTRRAEYLILCPLPAAINNSKLDATSSCMEVFHATLLYRSLKQRRYIWRLEVLS